MNHTHFDLLRSAVVHYGYWAVAGALFFENAGIPLPGETILLLASFLAYSEHDLQLSWIIAIGTVVTAVGGSLGFALGYYGGRPLLDRYRTAFRVQDEILARGEKLFERYGAVTIFFSRFVFGMRLLAGPMAGVLRMPWKKFLIFNFLGGAAWVSVVASAGYLFGRHWGRLERFVKRFDIAVVILALLAIAYWLWRKRSQKGTGHPGS
jgi:membrane protein DedA with SNARE-associated domain